MIQVQISWVLLLCSMVVTSLPLNPNSNYAAIKPSLPGYPDIAPIYKYAYGVNDPQYGPVFSHSENRENYETAGEYRVNLPDGRVQIVSYTAGPNGYLANVRYDGEAKYPEYTPYKPTAQHSPIIPYQPTIHQPVLQQAKPVYHIKPLATPYYAKASTTAYTAQPPTSVYYRPISTSPKPKQYSNKSYGYKPISNQEKSTANEPALETTTAEN